jgi:hypothetical protein
VDDAVRTVQDAIESSIAKKVWNHDKLELGRERLDRLGSLDLLGLCCVADDRSDLVSSGEGLDEDAEPNVSGDTSNLQALSTFRARIVLSSKMPEERTTRSCSDMLKVADGIVLEVWDGEIDRIVSSRAIATWT